jgi:histidyl-tRNA synthetase
LRVLQIPFVHNQHLVRGLDYYSHTIFEIIHDHNGGEQQLGQSQSTVIAGGRYDGLLERLQSRTLVEDGNQQTPSIGWAAGINRLMMLLADKKLPAEPAPVLLIFLAPSDGLRQSLIIQYGLQLAQQLRTSDISVSFAAELLPSSASEKLPSSSKQLTRLLRRCSTQPKYALFIGDAELDSQTITVKDLIASKQQPLVSIKQFIAAANSRRPIDA